jgi:hypothetical protein
MTRRAERVNPVNVVAIDGANLTFVGDQPVKLRVSIEDYQAQHKDKLLGHGRKRPKYIGIKTDDGPRYAARIPVAFRKSALPTG